MSDGATTGVGAERALETVLGGAPQPAEEEMESVGAMRDRLLAMTTDPHTYGGTADFAASLILRFLLADPTRAQIPTENVYELGPGGRLKFDDEGNLKLVTLGLHGVMKAAGDPYAVMNDLDLTGFMWGWAVNAARRCCELAPVPNPAIVTLG